MAASASQKGDVHGASIVVVSMRPATVLALIALLTLLLVAGVVFVIQLTSVT